MLLPRRVSMTKALEECLIRAINEKADALAYLLLGNSTSFFIIFMMVIIYCKSERLENLYAH